MAREPPAPRAGRSQENSFGWAWAPNADDVSDAVLTRIAALTTEWENTTARSPDIGRMQIREHSTVSSRKRRF